MAQVSDEEYKAITKKNVGHYSFWQRLKLAWLAWSRPDILHIAPVINKAVVTGATQADCVVTYLDGSRLELSYALTAKIVDGEQVSLTEDDTEHTAEPSDRTA